MFSNPLKLQKKKKIDLFTQVFTAASASFKKMFW